MLTMGQAVQVPLARQHACTDEVLPSFRPSPPDALSPPAALPPLAPMHSVPERVQSQNGPLTSSALSLNRTGTRMRRSLL